MRREKTLALDILRDRINLPTITRTDLPLRGTKRG